MKDRIPRNLLVGEEGDSSLPLDFNDNTVNVPLHEHRILLRHAKHTQQHLSPGERSLHAPPPGLISHGCLLLPVFLAAWWYYTKQCIRKVTGFIRNGPEPKEGSERFRDKFFRFDDSYIRWEDILDDTQEGTRTDRFVKWINRRNVRRRHAKKDLRATTERLLSSMSDEGDSLQSHQKEGRRFFRVESSTSNCSFDPLSPQISMQWECLSDAGDMELCAMNNSTVVEGGGEDSIRSRDNLRKMVSREELMEARSMPTLTENASWSSDISSPFDEPTNSEGIT